MGQGTTFGASRVGEVCGLEGKRVYLNIRKAYHGIAEVLGDRLGYVANVDAKIDRHR